MAIRMVKVGQEVIAHPKLGDVVVNHSLRAKRVSITISGDGQIKLTLPAGGDVNSAMRFIETKAEWIEECRVKARARSRERNESMLENFRPLRADEIEQLYIQARLYLPQRCRELARQFNFRVNRVSVRTAKTRWGSCSSTGNISLNIFLMTLPKELIDYVIIHELCHTIHHDHSPRFHAEVDRCVGGREREYIRAIRGYRVGFVAKS